MASGDIVFDFGPQANVPPSSNAATQAVRNMHPILEFDDSTDEYAVFEGVMAPHYDGGGLTVYAAVVFETDTNTDHEAQLEISFERIGDAQQDIDSDGFAAVNDMTCTVPATCGNTEVGSVAFTDGADMDSVAAGELFRLKVGCDTSDSDFSDDCQLMRVWAVEA